MKQPKRGEIYFLDFSPSKGREIKGSHPALVIQNAGFVFPNGVRNLIFENQ